MRAKMLPGYELGEGYTGGMNRFRHYDGTTVPVTLVTVAELKRFHTGCITKARDGVLQCHWH